MKFRYKKIAALVCAAAIGCACALTGCSLDGGTSVYVTSIEQSETGDGTSTFIVRYSDGSTSQFSVANGKNGVDGEDGKDGKDVSVEEVYQKYVSEYGEISYEDFLDLYLSVNVDSSFGIGSALKSSLKVYTEFIETQTIHSFGTISDTAMYTGSAVVWKLDPENDAAYLVTNYHLVYDNGADSVRNGGSKLARRITCYLYGSEGNPAKNDGKDANGYSTYSYGDYAVSCEYVGGSITYDLAVLRADLSDLTAINEGVCAVLPADGYYVGQTAIAIGNTEGEGISVTKGVVSVDSEYIALTIDDQARNYRLLRIDTAIYSGNSGGGLFDSDGKLIGITNSGNVTDQNINYAIPIETVRHVVDNLLYYAEQSGGIGTVKRAVIGITVDTENARYVYDASKGYGRIEERVVVSSVSSGYPAEALSLSAGDVIDGILINGEEYGITRDFLIGELCLTVRAGDEIAIRYTRDGVQKTTAVYALTDADFKTE